MLVGTQITPTTGIDTGAQYTRKMRCAYKDGKLIRDFEYLGIDLKGFRINGEEYRVHAVEAYMTAQAPNQSSTTVTHYGVYELVGLDRKGDFVHAKAIIRDTMHVRESAPVVNPKSEYDGLIALAARDRVVPGTLEIQIIAMANAQPNLGSADMQGLASFDSVRECIFGRQFVLHKWQKAAEMKLSELMGEERIDGDDNMSVRMRTEQQARREKLFAKIDDICFGTHYDVNAWKAAVRDARERPVVQSTELEVVGRSSSAVDEIFAGQTGVPRGITVSPELYRQYAFVITPEKR